MGLRLFYLVKPLIPRAVQIQLRRIRAGRIWSGLDRRYDPPECPDHDAFPWF